MKPDFEFNFSESDSDTDKDLSIWNFRFYPTFGKKYPHSDAAEDVTEEESTTEQIKVEELENQLLDVLDKFADRHNNV